MIGERRDRYRMAHLMSEAELQGTLIGLAQEQGWMVKPPEKQRSSASSGNRRAHRNGTAAGAPDLLMVRDGEVLLLELKDQTNKLSISQDAWALALGPSGRYVYEVIRPSDLARGRVDELLA